ncbi:MAG: hypothetical protein H0X29_10145 [Parachlamydiaceae bacterium]|nr:hypothetical protein [Parachlamydiaceae bacterium]
MMNLNSSLDTNSSDFVKANQLKKAAIEDSNKVIDRIDLLIVGWRKKINEDKWNSDYQSTWKLGRLLWMNQEGEQLNLSRHEIISNLRKEQKGIRVLQNALEKTKDSNVQEIIKISKEILKSVNDYMQVTGVKNLNLMNMISELDLERFEREKEEIIQCLFTAYSRHEEAFVTFNTHLTKIEQSDSWEIKSDKACEAGYKPFELKIGDAAPQEGDKLSLCLIARVKQSLIEIEEMKNIYDVLRNLAVIVDLSANPEISALEESGGELIYGSDLQRNIRNVRKKFNDLAELLQDIKIAPNLEQANKFAKKMENFNKMIIRLRSRDALTLL